MGNTVVWKPTPSQQLAAHYTMQVFEEADCLWCDQHGDR